jgi:predicted nucleic acid-binding protein
VTRAVLADTGPLYAAVDPDDQYHARAQGELQRLADAGLAVVLAHPILLEAYTLILYRLGSRAASAWLDDVRSGAAWVNPSPQDYRDATLLVGRFADQSITLFDATLAMVASRLRLPVWTYDHHFDTMQATVWR